MHRRTFYLLMMMSVGHVLLISAQVQSKSGLPLIEAAAFGTFARVQQGTASVADFGRGIWAHYFALRGVAAENDGLRKRVLELEGQAQQQEAIIAATHALEDALALQRSISLPTRAARVIAGSPAPDSLNVTIDRGAADGVQADMAVIAARGVVGRVINQPAAHAAQVQLMIGRFASAGVKLEGSDAAGVAVGGSGDPPLHIEYVKNSVEVKVGERVLTSGQDLIYPAGFLVGTVARAERKSGTYWTIAVTPAVDFSHIDIVLVVLTKPTPAVKGGS